MELLIESLVHGGDGLAHVDGRAVFVPFVVPGDRIRAKQLPARAGAARALLEEVLAPGLSRIAPPCAVAGTCGGCQWQHVGYVAQLSAKFETVRSLLSRAVGDRSFVLHPIMASPLTLYYRRRARFHPAGGGTLGFAAAEGAAVSAVSIDACLLVEPAVQVAFERVREAAGRIPRLASIGIDVDEAGHFSIDARTVGSPTPSALARAEALLKLGAQGIAVGEERISTARVFGDPILRDASGVLVRPDCFAQANRRATPLVVERALAALGPIAGRTVLELFAGAGTFTLPLLDRGAQVTAVESWVTSLNLLRAASEKRKQTVRLLAADSLATARALAASNDRFDAVLLDPPRGGARSIAAPLSKLTDRVVYVSCDPATLARDARELIAQGFRLEEATPIDLFPMTFHVEVVALFVREQGGRRD